MKKLLLLLLIPVAILVQPIDSKAEFTGGLKIGFNASKYIGNSTGFPTIDGYTIEGKFKFAPGVHIGPYVRVGLGEKYRIQAEVLFSTKGSTFDVTNGTGKEKYYRLPFYIDVPVFFNYKPIGGLYFELGVQPSFALTSLNFSANTTSTLTNALLNTVDISPLVGLGYEFKKITLGLRGCYGLAETNPTARFTGASAKNLTLMLTMGFKF